MGLSAFFQTSISPLPPLDTNAADFIAIAGITNTIQIEAINTLVINLKTNSLWDKLIAIYPIVGGTQNSHKYNLKSAIDADSSYRLQFLGTGSPIHDSTGLLWSGAQYARTFLSVASMANISLSYYVQTSQSSPTNDVVIGVVNVGTGCYLQSSNSASQAVFTAGNSYCIASNSVSGEFLQGSAIGGRSTLSKNGVVVSSNSAISNAEGELIFGGLGRSMNGTSVTNHTNTKCSFASIGNGLTDGQLLIYTNIVNRFQTKLGRK